MPDSLRGQFLIAGKSLRDPNFYQSVVLIVEHGDGGTMGVVVNRPSGLTVTQALQKHFELPETGEMVYVGGPVERNALFILHNADDVDSSETPVLDDLFMGSSPDTFEDIVQRAAEGNSELKYRVYFGCAGWAPEQLEGELARNDWLVFPATQEFVFHPDPYDTWELLVAAWNKANPLLPGVIGKPGAQLTRLDLDRPVSGVGMAVSAVIWPQLDPHGWQRGPTDEAGMRSRNHNPSFLSVGPRCHPWGIYSVNTPKAQF